MKTAIVTIIMFLLMVSIHEFGHFIVAKLCGVKVNEFAIGMGPAIFKRQGKETLYSFRIFPVGGFCAMEGESESSESSRAFCNQKPWKRLLVVIAGAFLNAVLGLIIFIIIFSMTAPFFSTTISNIDPNSYAATSGLQVGDKVVKLNKHKINFYPDINLYSSEFKDGADTTLTVKRGTEKLEIITKPSYIKQIITYDEIGATVEETVNGKTETTHSPYKKDFIPSDDLIGSVDTQESYKIGIGFEYLPVNAGTIFVEGAKYTVFVIKMVYKAFFDMITGNVGLEQMSGPVGVVNVVNEAVNSGKYSIINILNLMGMLTINLGVFNLLPIPALDGSRGVFIILEMIRRKPIPTEKENLVHVIGFMCLMIFIVFITFNDILNLIK